MGIFDKNNKDENQSIDLGKSSGKIDLSKGKKVTIAKTPVIKAKAIWSSNTDYDLYAIVLMKNGQQFVVSTFGSKEQPSPTTSILDGAVRHLGDVGRTGTGQAEETIEIRLTDEIDRVIPVAYSAQSNGGGSFRKYQVTTMIDNGAGDTVTINSTDASRNPMVFTMAIGAIINTPAGVVIEGLEKYSRFASENRPAFVNGELKMDAGSRNIFK